MEEEQPEQQSTEQQSTEQQSTEQQSTEQQSAEQQLTEQQLTEHGTTDADRRVRESLYLVLQSIRNIAGEGRECIDRWQRVLETVQVSGDDEVPGRHMLEMYEISGDQIGEVRMVSVSRIISNAPD